MDTQMINFSIPKSLLRKVDKLAKKDARNRSEFLRESVRRYIQESEERARDFTQIRASAKKINMSEEEAMALIDRIRDSLPMNQ